VFLIGGVAAIYLYIAAREIDATAYGALSLMSMVLFGPLYVAVNAARYHWCAPARVGTDYTLQSSLTYVAQSTGAIASAALAAALGWVGFYALAGAVLVMVPLGVWAMFPAISKAVRKRDEVAAAPVAAGVPGALAPSARASGHSNGSAGAPVLPRGALGGENIGDG
jgi:hypothetical protein